MFCNRLRAAMKSSGMRASDLARLCDVKRQTPAKWLAMKEARLSAVHLFCIADAMGADPRHLVTGSVKRPTQKKVAK